MPGPLTDAEIEAFERDGYVALREAVPRAVADECRAVLWERLGLSPDDPSGWSEPVLRLPPQFGPPFTSVESPRLCAATDQLVGAGRWRPHRCLGGTTPVRFPVPGDPGDDGWHVDGTFPHDGTYGLDVRSTGRALLLLVLLSEVGPDDAPTRIRVGSHLPAARVLAAAGGPLRFDEVVPRIEELDDLPVALATGAPGDVYICHPFLVHAAQRHRGTRPRFLAQPGVLMDGAYDVEAGTSPVERTIRRALAAPGVHQQDASDL